MTEVRWLDGDQQRAWRAYLRGSAMLMERLDHELRAAHGLSGDDYEVLVALSEGPDEGVRMTALAEHSVMSKSRLTYTVDRMAREGLLVRRSCPEDGRGLLAVLTAKGRRLLEAAAITHVAGVRRWFIDVLSEPELTLTGDGLARVVDQLEREGRRPTDGGCTR